VLSELLSTDREGDGQDGRHRDGDTTDEQYKNIVETIAVRVVVSRVQDGILENDEDADNDQTERADLGEIRLQVASRVIILADQRRSTSEKVLGPVEITTPSASPCLQVEPLKYNDQTFCPKM